MVKQGQPISGCKEAVLDGFGRKQSQGFFRLVAEIRTGSEAGEAVENDGRNRIARRGR